MTPIWGMNEHQTKMVLWGAGSFLFGKVLTWLLFGLIMWMRQ
jgi:hypothetical protein